MQKIMRLPDTDIAVELRRNRQARFLRLSVRADGSVRMTVPFRASLELAERFLRERADWIVDSVAEVRAKGGMTKEEALMTYQRHKKAALVLASERVRHFAPLLGVRVLRISVRDQRTRWGSCSRSGALCFNYRIALLPTFLVDYLVVHELAHVREFNHSAAFWKLVATCVPGYKDCRRMLKQMKLGI